MGVRSRQRRGTERERSEMYLLLFLLISPAFGRPSSAQPAGVNKLDDLNKYNKHVSDLLKDSRLFGSVVEDLKAARENVVNITADLEFLQTKIDELRNQDNYIDQFNKAIVSVNQTRRDLRKLARRTVTEANGLTPLLQQIDRQQEKREKLQKLRETNPELAILLDSVDINNDDPSALKSLIEKMKGLMLETKERLEEAREKYQSAHLIFDNLDSSVTSQNSILDRAVKDINAQYQADKEYTEKVRYNCKWAAVFTLGLCSLIHHFANEVPLERSRVELANLQSRAHDFGRRVKTLNGDIDAAIEVINAEIELISIWAVSAEIVKNNIDQYPAKHLDKFAVIRNIFEGGLHNLTTVARDFLIQTEILFKSSVA